eukprot:2894514-Rhodomonas_salina.2
MGVRAAASKMPRLNLGARNAGHTTSLPAGKHREHLGSGSAEAIASTRATATAGIHSGQHQSAWR